jgi:hypothetical protein
MVEALSHVAVKKQFPAKRLQRMIFRTSVCNFKSAIGQFRAVPIHRVPLRLWDLIISQCSTDIYDPHPAGQDLFNLENTSDDISSTVSCGLRWLRRSQGHSSVCRQGTLGRLTNEIGGVLGARTFVSYSLPRILLSENTR